MPFTYVIENETLENPIDNTTETLIHVCVETINGKNVNHCFMFPLATSTTDIEAKLTTELTNKGYAL